MTVASPSVARPARPSDGSAATALLEEALARAGRHGTVVVASLPAPPLPVAAMPFLGAAEGAASAFLFPGGDAVASSGEAARIDVRGAERWEMLRAQIDSLFGRLEVVGEPPAVAPRLYGGLAFAAGGAQEAPWSAFGEGSFVLPRWSWAPRGERGVLSFAVDGRSRRDLSLPVARAELERITDLFGIEAGPAPLPRVLEVSHLDEALFRDGVEAIREDIARAAVSKVVLARRSTVRLDGAVDPAALLHRLSARFPRCTCFAIRRGGATFVGATPERLFARRGRTVLTEALAGSIDARTPDGARALLESHKDRAEHDLVVRDVWRRLAPLCAEVHRPERPDVRALPHVLHMHTPIRGVLRAQTHVVDLLAALHPTPAVGGVPAEAALDRIGRLEAHPRGWYAGPVGWIDARGDAEMSVALRAGLLHGRRAFVYAGAGIVGDSRPEAEYLETGLKMRALLEALGVAP